MELVGTIYGILFGVIYICYRLHKEEPGMLSILLWPPVAMIIVAHVIAMIWVGIEYQDTDKLIIGIFLLVLGSLGIFLWVRVAKDREKYDAERLAEEVKGIWAEIDTMTPSKEELKRYKSKEQWFYAQVRQKYYEIYGPSWILIGSNFWFKSNQDHYINLVQQYQREREERNAMHEQGETRES